MALPCANPFSQFVPLSFHHDSDATRISVLQENTRVRSLGEIMPSIRSSSTNHRLIDNAYTTVNIRPNADGKLPNRAYYPSDYHQQQFDSIASNNYLLFDEREAMGLNSLTGGINDPPRYSMPVLIECAILGSPEQKLTYGELRITLKTRFRHFQREEDEGSKSWERTLMQNLSKKERFMIIERASYQASLQGGYWTINPNVPPYNHNPKRTSIKRSQKSTAFMRVSPVDSTTIPITTTEAGPRRPTSDSNPKLGGEHSLFRSISTSHPESFTYRKNQTYIQLPVPQPNPREARITSPHRWKLVADHEHTTYGKSTIHSLI